MFDITFGGAALAGLLSFLSPCILPMVPFYLCYMAGLSMAELRDDQGLAPGAQRRLVLSSIAFALDRPDAAAPERARHSNRAESKVAAGRGSADRANHEALPWPLPSRTRHPSVG